MIRRSASVVVTTPGVVVLAGPAVLHVARAVRSLLGAYRRDGVPPPPSVLELDSNLARAVAAARASMSETSGNPGHADADPKVRMPACPADGPKVVNQDQLSIGQAAALLGIGERQMRRLAPQIGGRRHGHRWVIDRTAVEVAALERNAS